MHHRRRVKTNNVFRQSRSRRRHRFRSHRRFARDVGEKYCRLTRTPYAGSGRGYIIIIIINIIIFFFCFFFF